MQRNECNLSQKIILATLSSFFIFGMLVGVYTIYKEKNYRTSSLHSEIIKTASFLVNHAYILLKQNNAASLLHETQVVHQNVSQGNFIFVEIVDAKGNLKVPYDPLNAKPKIHDQTLRRAPWNSLALGQDYLIGEASYDDVGPVIEGVFGIVEYDRILGYVVLGISKKPIEELFRRNLVRTLFILFALWALAVGVTWKWNHNKLKMVGKMEKMARIDSMTGLLNRQTIMEEMHKEFAIAERKETSVFIVLADLDHFKTINDTYGHLLGDHVIRAFASVLSSSRRAGEAVGRFGGEEFLILLPNTNRDGAEAVAAKILEEVRAKELILDSGDTLKFRVSLGMAQYPKDGLHETDVLHKADLALYGAKAQGRDQAVFWNANMSPLQPLTLRR